MSEPRFCDTRDGKKYMYVAIPEDGTGQKWMAENLDYNASGSKCGRVTVTGTKRRLSYKNPESSRHLTM